MSSVMPLNFNAVDLHVAIIGGKPHVPEKCARQCCMKKHMSIPTMSWWYKVGSIQQKDDGLEHNIRIIGS